MNTIGTFNLLGIAAGGVLGTKLLAILWALLILLIGYIAIRIITSITAKALKRTKLDEALHTFILSAVRVLLWIIVIITCLSSLGIPTSTFVAVLGACGAAIALALKDSLSNIAGGILLMANKPFSKGDFVDIHGTTGVVDSIDLMTTTLKTYDNKVICIPNGSITTGVLINYTKEKLRRVDRDYAISYGDDIGKAREVILAVAAANDTIKTEPEPSVKVTAHGDNAVILTCYVWCDTEDYWDVRFFMDENVKIAFDEAGLSIPFPQMDVHIVK